MEAFSSLHALVKRVCAAPIGRTAVAYSLSGRPEIALDNGKRMVEVLEYLDQNGYSPFADWFNGLDAQADAKVSTAQT
jgi:hypothetical protein